MNEYELLPNNTRFYTAQGCAVLGDSVLLADFVSLPKTARVLDVCCGSGLLAMRLADAGHTGEIVCADINEAALALLKKSSEEAGFENITILQCDAREFSQSRKFDAVVCNPPYFGSGKRSGDPARAAARHTDSFGSAQLFECAERNLKQGGGLYFCSPAQQSAQLLAALPKNNLSARTLQYVFAPRANKAFLMLCEARYFTDSELCVLPQIVLDQTERQKQ